MNTEFEIVEQSTAEVLASLPESTDRVSLIISGYSADIIDPIQRQNFAANEYKNGQTHYFFYINHLPIACLSVVDISSPENPIFLGQQDDDISQLGINWLVEPSIFWISGIVTDPRYRAQGFAKTLIDNFAKDYHPDIILAQTRSVGAVLARVRALYDEYLTLFGGKVMNEEDQKPYNHLAQLLTSIFYRDFNFSRVVQNNSFFIHLVQSEMIKPGITEDTARLSTNLKAVINILNQANLAQINENSGLTAVCLHISIRKELLEV